MSPASHEGAEGGVTSLQFCCRTQGGVRPAAGWGCVWSEGRAGDRQGLVLWESWTWHTAPLSAEPALVDLQMCGWANSDPQS